MLILTQAQLQVSSKKYFFMNAIPTSKFQNLNTGTTFTLTKNVPERQPTLIYLHLIVISHTFQTNKQTLHTHNQKYCFCFITNFIVLLKQCPEAGKLLQILCYYGACYNTLVQTLV
jgi:hypothetical protein